jgi:hypothetical protein
MNPPFRITSRLPVRHRPALEELLFFNARQDHLRQRIVETIDRYGMPEVVERDGTLRVRLAGAEQAQSLFAVDAGEAPLGLALFVREDEERFVIVHIGVVPAYAADGPHAHAHLFFHLLQAIRAAARRTRGVRYVDLFYGAGRMRHIPV